MKTDNSPKFWIWLERIILAVIVILVISDALANRYAMNPDGISYLDMASSLQAGEWGSFINGYWSPLYPALIALVFSIFPVDRLNELFWLQGLNVLLYLGMIGAFLYFLKTPTHWLKTYGAPEGGVRLLRVTGLCLILLTPLSFYPVHLVTPDALVAGIAFVLTAMLITRSQSKPDQPKDSWKFALLFGALCGLGYLAKAIFLPLGLVFIFSLGLTEYLRSRKTKEAAASALLATVAFFLLALPWGLAISSEKDRFTFGDTGRLAYIWYANDVHMFYHWKGGPEGAGQPVNKPEVLLEEPEAIYFGAWPKVTYPLWHDASYWYEGVKSRFIPDKFLKNVKWNLEYIYIHFKRTPVLGFLLLIAGLFVFSIGRFKTVSATALCWPLLFSIPSLAAVAAYTLVHAESRYLFPFILMLLILMAGMVVISTKERSERFYRTTAVLFFVLLLFPRTTRDTYLNFKSAAESAPPAYILAGKALAQSGLPAGTPIFRMGFETAPYWARMAELRIAGEIVPRQGGLPAFLRLTPEEQKKFYEKLRTKRGKAVVAHAPGLERDVSLPPNWLPLPGPYLLNRL